MPVYTYVKEDTNSNQHSEEAVALAEAAIQSVLEEYHRSNSERQKYMSKIISNQDRELLDQLYKNDKEVNDAYNNAVNAERKVNKSDDELRKNLEKTKEVQKKTQDRFKDFDKMMKRR